MQSYRFVKPFSAPSPFNFNTTKKDEVASLIFNNPGNDMQNTTTIIRDLSKTTTETYPTVDNLICFLLFLVISIVILFIVFFIFRIINLKKKLYAVNINNQKSSKNNSDMTIPSYIVARSYSYNYPTIYESIGETSTSSLKTV